ncbi:MAG: ATP-binding protein [Candidatus Saccharibacteria bacterium]|nr:ATP-binding protein [Candidatus Saccharibacteria bacterium]
MALKRFPIGVQDFAQIRNNGYFYVDKTDLVYNLTHTNQYYFLSRPRRFGKSLLVSTLQCYFEARKELFTGLAMERLETEWKKYPVLKISFAGNKFITEQDLADTLQNKLSEFEKIYGLKIENTRAWGVRLENILKAAYAKTGMQPVVLVDEYDAPLLDSMDKPELQQILKEEMRKFFSPLKDQGEILRFVFLTGISKFSQLSIFSELNNLNIITMDNEYAAICGITKEEVLTQMQPEIQALADKQDLTYDEACAALQKQYDGYHFSKKSPDIYNPYSLINSLSKGELDNYWFATGTPTILTKLVKKFNMEPEAFSTGFEATQEMFDTPTETATNPIPMLYQSGYLTIKKYNNGSFAPYILAFPNKEVSDGFSRSLLYYYGNQSNEYATTANKIIKGFQAGDIDAVLNVTKAYLSQIPYDAEKPNELHYKTIIYCLFLIITPYLVRCEEKSAAGRADIVVETANSVYVFEFKLDASATAGDALKQIDDKGYLIPYSATLAADGTPKKLYKIGVSFDAEKRTIGEWKVGEG